MTKREMKVCLAVICFTAFLVVTPLCRLYPWIAATLIIGITSFVLVWIHVETDKFWPNPPLVVGNTYLVKDADGNINVGVYCLIGDNTYVFLNVNDNPQYKVGLVSVHLRKGQVIPNPVKWREV